MDNKLIDKLNSLLKQVSLIKILEEKYKVLHRGGSKYTVQCPFHKDGNESHPSMSVDDDKGLYQCFTCGAKGNVITYLKEKENLSFKDAINNLGKRFSIDVSDFFSAEGNKKAQIFDEAKNINKLASIFFSSALLSKDKNNNYKYDYATKYLKKRKIPISIVKEFKLGLAPPIWDSLFKSISKSYKNVSYQNLLALGLVRESRNKDGRYFDNFINRIIFPIINHRGEIIGFGGRSVDGSEPKYLNSKESIVFKKKSVLYGINVTKNHIMQADSVILTEGYMDVIGSYKSGVCNVLATLGTAITEFQMKEIKKYTKNIVLSLDNDDAGIRATRMAILHALKEDLNISVIDGINVKDLDEYFTLHTKEEFDIVYSDKLNWYDWIIKKELNGEILNDLVPKRRLDIADIFHNFLNAIESDTQKDILIRYISEKLSIAYEAFKNDYKRKFESSRSNNTQTNRSKQSNIESKKNDNNRLKYENSLIYLLTLNPSIISIAEKAIDPELIEKDLAREYYLRLLTLPIDASVEDALNILGSEKVSEQILLKRKFYEGDIKEKLNSLIIKIKDYDIYKKRIELKQEKINIPMETSEGFEALCIRAREIDSLKKEREKLYEGNNI